MKKKTESNMSDFVDKTIKKTKSKKFKNETKALLRKISRYPNIKDVEKYISRVGLFKVKPEFRPHTGYVDGGELRKYYYELIKEKTLKDDKKLMDDIIKLRTKILQHRMSCEVGLYEKGALIAGLKIYKILIEHGQEVVDFWIGKSIDASSFSQLVNIFSINMGGKFGAGTVNITQHPIKRGTVDGISTEFEFS
ncbi:MAG: hypothetical protein ABIH59_02620 [archaeon]